MILRAGITGGVAPFTAGTAQPPRARKARAPGSPPSPRKRRDDVLNTAEPGKDDAPRSPLSRCPHRTAASPITTHTPFAVARTLAPPSFGERCPPDSTWLKVPPAIHRCADRICGVPPGFSGKPEAHADSNPRTRLQTVELAFSSS